MSSTATSAAACAEAARAGLDQHVREARLERQARRWRGRAAVELAVVVDRAEPRQPRARLGERGGGRRVEEGQARRVGLAPQQAGQQQARQVGLEDFGRVVRGQRGGRGFLPQADRDARAPGARRGRRAG